MENEIEQTFAAAVVNARGYARLANTAGCVQTAADQIDGALIELWEAGHNAGMSDAEIQAIADRYVDGDVPRSLPNVVPFRR